MRPRTLCISLLLLLPFIYLSAQEEKQEKFAVGVGYSFNSLTSNELHPLEVSLQYHFNQKHSLFLTGSWDKENYVNIKYYPFRSKILDIDECEDQFYGIEAGYSLAVFNYKRISFFGSVSLSYQKYDKDLIYNQFRAEIDENAPPSHSDYHIKHTYSLYETDEKIYSFIPQVGINYTWKYIGLELKYKLYMSIMNCKKGMSFYNSPHVEEYFNEDEAFVKSRLSLSMFIYF